MNEVLQEIPTFTKLTEKVIRILGLNPNEFTLQVGTNTYLIGTGPRKFLLDTGEGKPEYTQLLFDSLKKLGENIIISDIIISHWHTDHVGGIDSILQYARENNLPLPVVHKRLDHKHDKPHQKFQQIADNQIFKTDGASLIAIFTPGHSEDHVAFYLEEEKAIFSGDTVLGQGTTVFEDLGKYIDSLHKLKQFTPGRLYPGHGPVIENGTEKLGEYITHRLEREKQIIEEFKTSKSSLTPRQIVEKIYAKYPESLWPAAERGVILHLIKLEKEGVLQRLSPGSDSESLRGKWAHINSKF
ncbi:497_t:CDS:2 [Funneliformis geosporum]|uniref:16841_t:CDS:1 n=1 Tax=Funneliformis geosporum TaxID=1117311 RepID=A0A9W4WSJ3_9GLOM|nr:16841_t:CDS:2 [Funneliformis geosporum]CAI2185641.1 497_t:CDS:2 [Funneliformis geosporum]